MPGGRRSPIDRALREYARVRRHVGPGRSISLDEAVHVAERLSRRDFLRIGGIAGASAVLAACDRGSPEPAQSSNPRDDGRALPPRVAIVGAGLAGMTAAYRLHQAGIRPLVFEARDRIGGRCWSARDWAGGQVGEHGGEFVDTRHVHMRVLVEELGLELDDLWSAWVPGSTWLTYVDGEIVRARDEFRSMAPAVDEIVVLAAAGPLEAGATPSEIAAFDEMTAAEWYVGAVGDPSTGLYRLWTQRLAGWYGLDPEQLGAGNLIDFYATDYPGGDERYTVRGGNDQVPTRIFEELPEGTVTLGVSLESVRAAGDTVELRFGGMAAPVVADRAILAVPFTTLRHVDLDDSGFSVPMLTAIDELGMGTNAKVLLQFDRPFYTGFDDWSGGMNRGDEPILGTWESGATDGAEGLGLLTVYSGGRVGASYAAEEAHAPAAQGVIDETLEAVDQVVPGVAAAFNERAWLDSWVQDPWVGGSYAAFLPGQLSRFWGAMGEPQGAVHIAGEQTSTYSQGFLNGGVESGSRAATEVLEALGIALPAGIVRSNRLARRFRPTFPGQE
jgi:monoamine oxidase